MTFHGFVGFLSVLTVVAYLPFYLYLLVVSLAALRSRREPLPDRGSRRRFLVIIPAHDEESGIAATVRSCLDQDYPDDRYEVVVVADNCTDATASLAELEGAEVLERSHPTERSKGHALKFVFDRLRQSGRMEELDAFVIIDADTVVDRHLLRTFASYIDRGHDWIQAFDTVANVRASWRTKLMTYSFSLINGVLIQGQNALGLSAGFRGNGMCFTVRGLERRPWRTFGLVEDIEYSWSIRAQGEKIAFAPEASVYATMLAHGGSAAKHQRQRWETGRRDLKREMFGPILRSTRLGPIEKLAAIIELQMPALVALAIVLVMSMLGTVYLLLDAPSGSGSALPSLLAFLNALSATGLALYGIAPLFIFNLPRGLLLSLAYLPAYALWKLWTSFQAPPARWIRTARESLPTSRVPREPMQSAAR